MLTKKEIIKRAKTEEILTELRRRYGNDISIVQAMGAKIIMVNDYNGDLDYWSVRFGSDGNLLPQEDEPKLSVAQRSAYRDAERAYENKDWNEPQEDEG